MTDGASRVTESAGAAALETAAAGLLRGEIEVVWEGALWLRLQDGVLRCAVLEPGAAAHRCEEEYKVLIENAARRFDTSAFRALLGQRRMLRWSVAEVTPAGVDEVYAA